MSVKPCITGKANKGIVDRERAKRAMDLFDQNLESMRGRMGAADADAQAGARTIAFLERELARKKANAARMAHVSADIKKFMGDYRTASGNGNQGRAALSVLNRDPFDQTGRTSVWSRQQAILGQLHMKADAVVESFRPHIGGIERNRAGQANVIRELFGEKTGDKIAEVAAKAWGSAAETARVRFNRAGGNIPHRKDWVAVQSHDMLAVGDVPEPEWIDFVVARVDPSKMIDESTGLPMSAQNLVEYLHGAYDEIATGGWASREPQFSIGRPALANTRRNAREIHFLNADSWLEYQKKFGKASVFDAMTTHFEHMAMDIAQLEVLGPNPRAMLNYMGDLIQQDAAGKGRKALNKASKDVHAMRLDFDELSGRNSIPIDAGLARGFSGLKNILVSAQLGSASLTAISDLATVRMAAKYNGLPVTGVGARMLKLFDPRVTADKRLAVRAGLIAENWSSMALAQRRYTGEIVGPRWTQMFSDAVLKVSGLSPWTQAGRWAFGLEFSGHLGDFVGRALDEMPVETRGALQRYGITAQEWATVSKSALLDHRGAQFLSPPKIMDVDQELGTKIAQMILSETEFAVPTVTPRTRRQLRLSATPGTAGGIVMSSFAMYKSFPVQIVATHVMRGLNQSSLSKKGRYLASLIVSTTIMGGLAWQLKHISKGRDPEDMTTAKFWASAMVQGGGAGLFGDFLLGDVNRFGQGPAAQLAGPIIGFGEDLTRLAIGNIQQGLQGDEANVGKELVRFGSRYMPGTSLWYSRLALERLIFDELERMVDPDASANFRRSESARRRETGQEFFWHKGDAAPDRWPDLSAAIGK